MSDTDLRRECIQTMQKGAPLAMSISGMKGQNVRVAIFHSGSNVKPSFVTRLQK